MATAETKRETEDKERREAWSKWRELVKASPLYGTLGRGQSMCDFILPCPNCQNRKG